MFQFPSRANLRRHNIRKHIEDCKKFPCQECGKEFKLEYDMVTILFNSFTTLMLRNMLMSSELIIAKRM